MQLASNFLAFGLLSCANASRLFVSSYSGNIATVEVTDKANGVDLKVASLSQDCQSSPSWLQYNSKTSTLYCADEGNATPGQANLTSLKVGADGSLTLLDNLVTANGGVSTDAFMVGKDRFMAVAHYGGSAISIVNTTDPSDLVLIQRYTFTFDPPRGTDPTKPVVPLIHQVVVDPTGSFLLAPNLSGDEVHVFGLNENGLLVDPAGQPKLLLPAGSGPRHIAFYQPEGKAGKTYVYVVMEKMNMLHGYEVTYSKGTMQFQDQPIYMSTIFGGDQLPAGSAAAEITVTPDNKFLIISSRLDKLNPPGPMSPNSPSDTMVTFSLDPTTGKPTLLQKFSAGGIGPRSFAINRAGDRVAVALATSNKLVILSRDVKAGTFTAQLGSLDLDVGKDPGLVTSVVWEEESDADIVIGGGTVGGGASASAVSGTAPTPGSSLPSSSSSGVMASTAASGGSAAGSSLPSSASSGEDTTISTTLQITSTVTKPATESACQTPSSPETPTPMTLTRTISSVASGSMSNTASGPLSIIPTSAGSSEVMATIQTSQLTMTTSVIKPTPTRFPTTSNPESSIASSPPIASSAAGSLSIISKPGYFATMESGSSSPTSTTVNSSNKNGPYTETTFVKTSTETTAVPSPVRTGIVGACKEYYQVVKGDTCDGICEKGMVPKKNFWEWNSGIDEECKGLEVGEWVCVEA